MRGLFRPAPGVEIVSFEFRSGPFCQGQWSPAPSVDPPRIVCPRPSASRRLAAFPRRSACRSRTADRPQHAAQVQTACHRRPSSRLRRLPRLIETHTEDRNLTYSAGLCPDSPHLFRAVWPGRSSGSSHHGWWPLSSPRRQIAQYTSNLAIMFQNRDLTDLS